MNFVTTTILLGALIAVLTPMSGQFARYNRACRVVDIDSCSRTIVLSIPTFFRPGDQVLLHQAMSADSTLVGVAEFNTLDTIVSPYAYLRHPFTGVYNARENLQVVRVTDASELSGDSAVHAMPWNGDFGGVLAISARDTLYLSRSFNARNAGFRSRRQASNSRDTMESTTAFVTEGALPTRHGHARNGGGYGGSLASHGGRGGATTTAYTVSDTMLEHDPRLLPSRDTSRLRIFLGSAGGTGHQNDLRGGAGGIGGGAVLVKAPVVIASALAAIDVSGGDGEDAYADGAGGGGSGGSITLLSDTVVGSLWCDVSGGIGGSTHGTIFRYGPGGGGAGGLLQISNINVLRNLRVQRGGGASGGSQLDTSDTRTLHGAQPGTEGVLRITRCNETVARPALPSCMIVGTDTVMNDRRHIVFRTTYGTVRLWYLDSVARSGSERLVLPADTSIRRVAADIEIGGCITRRFIDMPVIPLAGDEIRVVVDQLRATAGDTVAVFVRIERVNGQASLRGTISLQLYQPVLIPRERRYRSKQQFTTVDIPFSLAREARSTFRRVEAIAVLGDSTAIQLGIDTVIVTPSSTRTQLVHGRLTLNDVCVTDRARLFDPASSIRIEGRAISIRADDALATNVLGQVLTRFQRGTEAGQLTGMIPDGYRGLCYVLAVRGGITTTHTFLIDD